MFFYKNGHLSNEKFKFPGQKFLDMGGDVGDKPENEVTSSVLKILKLTCKQSQMRIKTSILKAYGKIFQKAGVLTKT